MRAGLIYIPLHTQSRLLSSRLVVTHPRILHYLYSNSTIEPGLIDLSLILQKCTMLQVMSCTFIEIDEQLASRN